MTVATVTEIAADFAGYLKASKQGPVLVTRRGKPVAILLGALDEDELERVLLGYSPKLQEILEAARKRFRAGEGIPHERFWQEVEAENAAKKRKHATHRKNGRGGRKS